ncbi:MAG: YebC/PmpR family DNA-binding transcriptional regulator [Desulfovibrionaceae bacterium]|nr:YebC/PmpR family DNA-binding transcriptional regulator [Desulfovibrionaceae bacterium]MDD4952728.1 YebC/PmpR family DNA-binding transcriptional regulator [Desulfovibrionaceae bacterium]
MAGHSKWANIQHRKGRQDAKRAKLFTKAAKDIILAARSGGGVPEDNAGLRLAILKAKAVNMPNDKIDNAIKKGTGELAGGDLYETVYEGYAPGGVAMLIEVATDNKNRTVAEVRHILSKNGGSMGEAGSVAWMFDKKGVLIFDKKTCTEDQLLETGLEAGAEDVIDEDESLTVHTAPGDFMAAQQAFERAGLKCESAELSQVPKSLTPVDKAAAARVVRLVDALEDNEDVQNVYINADFPDEFLDELEG